jgi:pyruvate kinase
VELIALNVQYTLDRVQPAAVLVPTRSGDTARNITRYRLPVWITAFSPNESTCQSLQFSYGVHPILVDKDMANWDGFARSWLREHDVRSGIAVLTQGPSDENPSGNHRIEILQLKE